MPSSPITSSSAHRYHLYGVDYGGPSPSFSNMSLDRYTQVSTISGGVVCNCDHYHYPNNNDGDVRQLDGNEILRISTAAASSNNNSSNSNSNHQMNGTNRSGNNDNITYLPYDKQRRHGGECCTRCGSDIALMDPDRSKKNRKKQAAQQHHRNLNRQYQNDRKEAMRTRRLLLIIAIFVAYVSAGAAIFNAIEAKPEQDRKKELEDFIERFMGEY